jgi:hypothetical protein
MNASRVALAIGTSLATMWLTDQAMKRASLPALARPLVGFAAAAVVDQAVQRLR